MVERSTNELLKQCATHVRGLDAETLVECLALGGGTSRRWKVTRDSYTPPPPNVKESIVRAQPRWTLVCANGVRAGTHDRFPLD